MAHADGPGTIRRIWVTMEVRTPATLRGIVLRMYWDGESTPAVEAPLGDFFGVALGRTATFESAYFDSPEGRSFNCRFPMPFRKGMRITATNESPVDIAMFFYKVENHTVGDVHSGNVAYFHAHFRRQNPTVEGTDFEILPHINGRGRFLGCTVGCIADKSKYLKTWWGEGEVKIYLDGDASLPTLCGTGTEDYICTAWGQGRYAFAWYGCPIADSDRMEYSFYRLHGPDPVYFQREGRVTIQQIGYSSQSEMLEVLKSGSVQSTGTLSDGTKTITQAIAESGEEYGLFERQDDWCATSYFYLDKPTSDLPPIAPYAERVAGCQGDPPAE